MKQSEVTIGMECLTYVSGSLVRVRVTGEAASYSSGSHKRFHVSRADNGKSLGKARTAAALRPISPIQTLVTKEINKWDTLLGAPPQIRLPYNDEEEVD